MLSKTVLLVEDDPMVREVTRDLLRSAGFKVLEADHVHNALQLSERHEGPIDLLLTDVMMPGMGGRNVANELLVVRPGMKVLFMSGYTAELLSQQGVSVGKALLRKPFTPQELTEKVREALET